MVAFLIGMPSKVLLNPNELVVAGAAEAGQGASQTLLGRLPELQPGHGQSRCLGAVRAGLRRVCACLAVANSPTVPCNECAVSTRRAACETGFVEAASGALQTMDERPYVFISYAEHENVCIQMT